MVERELWVTTSRFENTETKTNFINPRCFGEDFAQWLGPRLAEKGLSVSDPIQEDWGWVIIVNHDNEAFTLSIGIMDESIGQVSATWRIGVAYEKALNSIRKWFKPAPVESLQTVFQTVEAVIANEPQFEISHDEP